MPQAKSLPLNIDPRFVVNALKEAGVSEEQANAHADIIQTNNDIHNRLHDDLVTRRDISDVCEKLNNKIDVEIALVRADIKILDANMLSLKSELNGQIASLRAELKGDMASLGAELKGDMTSLRAELKGDMTSLRAELKGDISSVRSEIVAVRSELKDDIRSVNEKLSDVEMSLRHEMALTRETSQEASRKQFIFLVGFFLTIIGLMIAQTAYFLK